MYFKKLEHNVKCNFFPSVDCTIYVCKYIECIASDILSIVDAVTESSVRKLRGEISYMLLAGKYHSWDEETERVRKMMFDD